MGRRMKVEFFFTSHYILYILYATCGNLPGIEYLLLLLLLIIIYIVTDTIHHFELQKPL